METIEIRGVWLLRQGDYAVVKVWMPDGTYKEVIREPVDCPFSHCVHAGGIEKAARTPSGSTGPLTHDRTPPEEQDHDHS